VDSRVHPDPNDQSDPIVGANPRVRPDTEIHPDADVRTDNDVHPNNDVRPDARVHPGQVPDPVGPGQTRGSAPTDIGSDENTTSIVDTDPRPSLFDVVRWFKSLTTAKYRHGVRDEDWTPFPGRLWQRNYYEHIIRNERSLEATRAYIYNNPANWSEDKLFDG